MGTAQSLYDAVDSQQLARTDNQASFNAGCRDTQQGARSECCTRTRSTADSREVCPKAGSVTARTTSTKWRSDFFCIDPQESRYVSCRDHCARWQKSFDA